jgi:hypothetical protein
VPKAFKEDQVYSLYRHKGNHDGASLPSSLLGKRDKPEIGEFEFSRDYSYALYDEKVAKSNIVISFDSSTQSAFYSELDSKLVLSKKMFKDEQNKHKAPKRYFVAPRALAQSEL